MYACRPALTIVSFRCIEQIMTHLGHGHHGHGHGHDHNQMDYKLLNEAGDDDHDDHDEHHDKTHGHDHRDVYIRFRSITPTELIILTPFILFVVVFDLMTLSNPNEDLSSKFDFGMWGLVFGGQMIWAGYVIHFLNKYNKLHSNVINVKHVFSKHWGLFVSALGLVIALIGVIGVNSHIWQIWCTYILNIGYVVSQCWVLVLLNETQKSGHDNDDGGMDKNKLTWKIKTFGKVVIILHVTLIIHAFLGEGYHLEETFDTEEEHDSSNVWHAIEFIFFFWSIEFHLACIERINMT